MTRRSAATARILAGLLLLAVAAAAAVAACGWLAYLGVSVLVSVLQEPGGSWILKSVLAGIGAGMATGAGAALLSMLICLWPGQHPVLERSLRVTTVAGLTLFAIAVLAGITYSIATGAVIEGGR